jgi:hypothetical protein
MGIHGQYFGGIITRYMIVKQIGFKMLENRISVASVRERIIPTERPPLVGEVGANF